MRDIRDVVEKWGKEWINRIAVFAYSQGFPEHSVTLDGAYRCSCGELLISDWEIGEHFKKGHRLKPIKIRLTWKVEVEEAE